MRFVLALLAVAASAPLHAQSLPDWAAPGAYEPATAEAAPHAFAADPTPPGGGTTPVPVDGGLGLLALAGAGYAVRRLRQTHA